MRALPPRQWDRDGPVRQVLALAAISCLVLLQTSDVCYPVPRFRSYSYNTFRPARNSAVFVFFVCCLTAGMPSRRYPVVATTLQVYASCARQCPDRLRMCLAAGRATTLPRVARVPSPVRVGFDTR